MASNVINSGDESEISGSRVYRRPLTVAVEGNIGSGKTTFLSYCKDKGNIDVFPEPIEEWKNFHGINLLVSVTTASAWLFSSYHFKNKTQHLTFAYIVQRKNFTKSRGSGP